MFNTNYEDVKEEYGLIPPGEYEVIIRNIEERTTPGGATGINLSTVIRNDVEQNYKDRYIFDTYWKRREPTEADMQVQGYSFKQIMRLAKSAKLPNGKAYETVQDLCKDLINCTLRLTIEHEEYNGKTRERVKYTNESKFPDCKHVYKEKSSPDNPAQQSAPAMPSQPASLNIPGDFEEILSDGDVPF